MKISGEQSQTKRLLSAVQPTGNLHIGNYLGAIKNWVKMQNEYESIFPIVDLHAITLPQDPKILKDNIRKTAAIYIACGIDPKKSKIFIQSDVSAHSELMWILNTLTTLGMLSRMTQFKDKVRKLVEESDKKHSAKTKIDWENENILKYSQARWFPLGIFSYPVLMAADILLYQTDIVPVGEDQGQHVELTSALAKRFNSKYGKIFKIPEIKMDKSTKRIMALDNPENKMSKSAESEHNYIALLDSDENIRKKIARAVTDSEATIAYNPEKKKGLTNLLHIYSAFAEKPVDNIINSYKNKGYKELKSDLSDLLIKKISPIRNKARELLGSSELDKILRDGKEFAQVEAEKTLKKVKKAIGLGL